MLVAKYVKILCRTGTRPFVLTCHVGTDSGLQYQESVGNLQPTGITATSEQRYFTDSNILSIPDCGDPLLANTSGIWQSSALRGRFSASYSPRAEGQKDRGKIYGWQRGLH